jgi:hypothetical protein
MSHQVFRDQLANLLVSPNAHVSIRDALKDFPADLRGRTVAGLPHTAWQLLEHIRLCQWDVLEYSRHADHVSPVWPDGYWPDSVEPPDETAWDESVKTVIAEMEELAAMALDETVDPLGGFAWEPEHNLMREIAIIAKHNSYHLGQLMMIRKADGN